MNSEREYVGNNKKLHWVTHLLEEQKGRAERMAEWVNKNTHNNIVQRHNFYYLISVVTFDFIPNELLEDKIVICNFSFLVRPWLVVPKRAFIEPLDKVQVHSLHAIAYYFN